MDAAPHPTSGVDYPGTWQEFLRWFPDAEACTDYIESLRWPEGFVCPRCSHNAPPYRITRGRRVCRACRHQTTVTAGTLFDKTRTPLTDWFAAAWYLTSHKHGVSALGLKEMLGLGSYQTAWAMLHRFRRAMVRPGRDRLSGAVEVDEVMVGGPIRLGTRTSEAYESRLDELDELKSIVVVAIERHEPKGFGRVRMRRIIDTSRASVLPFVRECIAPGSVVHTDGSPIYRTLSEHEFEHHRVVHLGAKDPAHVTMPGVNRDASLLKRWLMGTHQGSVRPKQLDYYLDEYTFRFNRRTSRRRGLLFYRLLQQAVESEPVTYRDITSGTSAELASKSVGAK